MASQFPYRDPVKAAEFALGYFERLRERRLRTRPRVCTEHSRLLYRVDAATRGRAASHPSSQSPGSPAGEPYRSHRA
jgi:hypothetical protein